ncbi:DUF4129 domain-containing protein [Mycolicibacterium sp.]|uniref:DUF4129 domain-containing protein n=1 Tax=Mycolicibacterium sp. TaxID=2320850 RepID=UPI001D9AE72E|nr:DUF4129 domain-containing protein [Mycolicibacterium sp.]MCB1291196.1 DUF4129 domain-containing protein [Mycobacterium sp.]MCB9408905.1 DUF4129 domain-containing protein [Mycolicibacterium sp.]
MPVIDIDRDSARDAAARELAKPIYPENSLSERLTEWFNDMLYRLIQSGSSLPGGWFTIVVLGLLTVATVVVAVRVARGAMGRAGGTDLYGSRTLSAADHRARSERSAEQGDWAGAIRQRVRAIGRQLEEDGTLSPMPGRTAAELAADAGKLLPGYSGELVTAAAAFDDVAYGDRSGTETDYRLVAGLDERLRRRVPGTGTGTGAITR